MNYLLWPFLLFVNCDWLQVPNATDTETVWRNCSRIVSVYKRNSYTHDTCNSLPTQSNSCISLQLVALLEIGGVYLKNPLSYFQSECIACHWRAQVQMACPFHTLTPRPRAIMEERVESQIPESATMSPEV